MTAFVYSGSASTMTLSVVGAGGALQDMELYLWPKHTYDLPAGNAMVQSMIALGLLTPADAAAQQQVDQLKPAGVGLTAQQKTEVAQMLVDAAPGLASVLKAGLVKVGSGLSVDAGGALGVVSGAYRPSVVARRAFDWPTSAVGVTATIVDAVDVPIAPRFVRVGYLNDTASSFGVQGIDVACAPAILDTGSTLTFVRGTFDDTSSKLPPSDTGSTLTVTVPAGNGAALPNTLEGLRWSDWILVTPVARNDGGAGYVVQVRTQFAAGARAFSGTAADRNALMSVSGWKWYSGLSLSGIVGVSGQSLQPIPSGDWSGIAAIEVMGESWSNQIYSAGDSIVRGQGTVATAGKGWYGWPSKLGDLLTAAGKTAAVANYGRSGRTTAATRKVIRQILANSNVRGSIFSVCCGSPNDIAAGANASACAVATSVAYEIAAAGAIPLLVTQIPTGSGTSASDEAIRKSANASFRTLSAANGWPLADMDVGMTDGATIASIPAALAFDSWHPNAAGRDVMAGIAQSAVSPYLR